MPRKNSTGVQLFPRRKHGQCQGPPAKGRSPVLIDRDSISALFGQPQVEAAKLLGISLTTLKQVSRKLGVSRWPYMRTAKKLLLALRVSGPGEEINSPMHNSEEFTDLADGNSSETCSTSCYSTANTVEDCPSEYSEEEPAFTPAAPSPCQDPDAPGTSQDDDFSHDDLAWLVGHSAHAVSEDMLRIKAENVWWHAVEYPAHQENRPIYRIHDVCTVDARAQLFCSAFHN